MADNPTNSNTAFMTGTDPALVNSLYGPVTNPQTPTTAPVANPTPAASSPATPTPSQSTTQAPAAQTAAATPSVVDLLNNLGKDSSYTGRAQLAQQLGIQNYKGTATQNQQLAQKYQSYYQSVKNTTAPTTSPTSDIAQATAPAVSADPVFNSMASMMTPIMQSLTQVLQDINNPAITGANLQTEYNTLAQQNKLPELQTEMLNMQNIMSGTEEDIRDEITKAGGTASESQVQAMTASRNKVILKQYNAVASQYQAAQTNVSNMMQYATTDNQTALAKQQATAGIVENMASIESQMMTMGMTMQQNAKQAVQYNVTQTGYTGLAASAQGNPQVLGYYEQMLSLAPGTLSNPQQLASLDTYKQQQLAISAQNAANAGTRTYIYAQSQGVSLPGSGGGTVTSDGTTAPVTITPSQLTRPSWLNSNVPLTMSSTDAQQYLESSKNAIVGKEAGTNQYGNNFDVPGVGHYVAQPDGSYILGAALPPAGTGDLSSLISSISNPSAKVPVLNYTDIKSIESNAPPSKYGIATSAFYREQRSARQLVGNFVQSPVYTTVSSAPLPFARIQAARNGNNSISDTELLDSYIMLAKGSGQITEAQIYAITSASSVSDKLNIIKQKVAGAGALISTDQRKSILSLSGQVFDEYATQYKNLYTQAINTLASNHVEPVVWGVVPDFTTMITSGDPGKDL